MWGAEAVEYSGPCVIQIRELEDDFPAGWPSVLFAHMGGLHAAGMRRIDLPPKLWPRTVRLRFTTRRDCRSGQRSLLNKPVVHREQQSAFLRPLMSVPQL